MSDRRSLPLLQTPALSVFDVHCSSPPGEPGPDEHAEVTQVVLPTEGVFEVRRGRHSVIADAASVVVLAAGHEHRVGHPATSGDRSIVLVFPPEVVDEVLDPSGTHGGPVGPPVHLGARGLAAAIRLDAIGELEVEEFAHVLLGMIGAHLEPARSYRPPGRHQRERVERVRALLAAEPARRWHLEELGRAVHCSPFHLARQFRAVTGTSIAASLLRLRLAIALQRLSEGGTHLADLAADLGFASQSHFGARFRSVFGASPGSIRDSLTAGRLVELRTFVTAQDLTAS